MRYATLWMAFGILFTLTPSVIAEEPKSLFKETSLAAGRGASLTIPPEYGDLISVVESSEVHHLYFQDRTGIIRIVLVGPKGAAQKAKHGLQLLSDRVYTIKREVPKVEEGY